MVIFVKGNRGGRRYTIERIYERMKAVEVGFKVSDNALTVKICGEIDAGSVAKLRRRIDVEYDCSGAKNMVFDLKDVGFMDSSGIGLIIGRYKRVAALGGVIKIKNANRTLKRIIELSGLGRIVKL